MFLGLVVLFFSSIATIKRNYTKKANKKQKMKAKYPNLRRAAANMGYNFSYLWRVLEGQPGFKGKAGLKDEFWAESARIAAEREARKRAKPPAAKN